MIKVEDRRFVINILGLKIKIKKERLKLSYYIKKLLINIFRIEFVSNYINKKYNYLNNKYNKDLLEGLLVYDYKSFGEGYYNPNDKNIGDYIQSLAAKQYFNNITNYIDRDSLKFYEQERINMIMNGWYYIYEGNNTFSSKINPLFLALHINNTNEVQKETIDYLKKYEPIGCRDYATRNYLLSNGVKAFFSGCLTTTLDIKYKKDNVNRKGIIFCDYSLDENCDSKIKKILNKILNNYQNEKVEYTTHIKNLEMNHEECFKLATELLNKYALAKLVITTRIHCALPCLALGTPVILVIKDYDKKRFDGLIQLLNTVGYNKNKKFIKNILFNEKKEVINSSLYKPIAENLKEKINNWFLEES